jgi:hypothetical protein
LSAFGHDNDHHIIFRNSALAFVDEVDGVAEAVTVKDVVSERLRWDAPSFKWVRAAHEE